MTKVTQMTLENDGVRQGRRAAAASICAKFPATAKRPLETVGQDLRAARLRRGDELATVSRALKIRKDHLEALEEDRLEDLPGKTYAIGFVRSYARLSGPGRRRSMSNASSRKFPAAPTISRASPRPSIRTKSRRLPQGWRIIAGVVVLLLIYGVWHLLSAGDDANQAGAAARRSLDAAQARGAKPRARAVTAPPQTATPSPATDGAAPPAPAAAPAAGSATPSPAAGAKTPATQAGADAAPAAAAPAGSAAAPPSGTARSMARRIAIPAWCCAPRGDTRITVRGADGTVYHQPRSEGGRQLPGAQYAGPDHGDQQCRRGRSRSGRQALGRAGAPQQMLRRGFAGSPVPRRPFQSLSG